MDFVTLKTFDNPIDAEITKGRLESENIECFIYDDNMMSLNLLYNIAIGGVKLVVNRVDLPEALKILEDIEATPLTDDNNEVIRCPNCGSTSFYQEYKTVKSWKSFAAMIAALYAKVYPPYYESIYKCRDCGTEFEKKDK